MLDSVDPNSLNATGLLNPDNITFLINSTLSTISEKNCPSPPPILPPPPPPPPSPSPPPEILTESLDSTSPPSPPPPPPPASTSPWSSPPLPSPSKSPSASTPTSKTSTTSSSSPSSASNWVLLVGGAIAGAFVVFFVVILLLVSKWKKRKGGTTLYAPTPNFPVQQQEKGQGFSGQSGSRYASQPSSMKSSFGSQRGNIIAGSKIVFSYEELTEITDTFSRQNMIGEGGFGCVYKGHLSDGRAVAVKQLKVGSGQGEREFRAEVEIISCVHHRHLVSLVGYCIAEHQRLLIYEFVPNKTLEHHLHGKGMPVLDWIKRLKIALGAAKGLAYLHEDCHSKIIHRDIKSANILLDDAFEAQVADFGLAKLTSDANTHVSTRVMGTFGYLAPEYATSGKLTDRSDVYSFGVVLLELVTGRKPVDMTQPIGEESLVEWARPLLFQALETGDFSELIDPQLGNNYVESEIFRMIEAAAACIRHSAPKRPRMARVVKALDCEGEESLSNGVKYGDSMVYNSNRYSEDIRRFRRASLSSGGDSMEFGSNTEFNSKSSWNRNSWKSRGNSTELK